MKNNHFGKCPRVLCQGQPLLPVGLSDIPRSKGVKLYCSRCEDIYQPKANRHINLDGAYFGTTFPHMLLQIYSHIVPAKSNERYVPRIYGFKIRDVSKIHEHQNEELKKHNQRALAYFQQ
jgi:casein kinase II subunit beta